MKTLTALSLLRVMSKRRTDKDIVYSSMGVVIPRALIEALGWEDGDQIFLWADPDKGALIGKKVEVPDF